MSSSKDDVICLKPEEIEIANKILLNVLESLKLKEKKQRGGGDKFDILASVLIAGMISASIFGAFWASGWILSIISSATNVSEMFDNNVYEACFSKKNISSITYILKGEIGKIIKANIYSRDVHYILSSYLRKTYHTYENFAEFCFTQMYQDIDP